MNKPLIVGSFVLASLALFASGLFMIGNRHEAFARHAQFYVEFSNLSGIAKGAKVQVAGMDAGEVVDVRIFGYRGRSAAARNVTHTRNSCTQLPAESFPARSEHHRIGGAGEPRARRPGSRRLERRRDRHPVLQPPMTV